jgi:hypothetical protein
MRDGHHSLHDRDLALRDASHAPVMDSVHHRMVAIGGVIGRISAVTTPSAPKLYPP